MVDPFAVHPTGLTVSALERSLAFYRDLPGFEVALRQEKEGGSLAAITGYPDAHVLMAQLELAGGGHRIELFQYLAPAGVPAPVEPRNVGITHVCVLVRDLPSLHARLREAGVATYSEPVEIE